MAWVERVTLRGMALHLRREHDVARGAGAIGARLGQAPRQRRFECRPFVAIVEHTEDLLLRRVVDRGRDFEKAMTHEFLGAMRAGYHEIVRGAACPVIDVNCEESDVLDVCDRAGIVARIRAVI